MVNSRQQTGELGEHIAAERLLASGFEILARNLRTRVGEIDILAKDGADLVFIEVRARRDAPGIAAESLSPEKLRRMWQCAMDYCEATGANPETARLDLISIDLAPRGTAATVEHFRGLEVPDR